MAASGSWGTHVVLACLMKIHVFDQETKPKTIPFAKTRTFFNPGPILLTDMHKKTLISSDPTEGVTAISQNSL